MKSKFTEVLDLDLIAKNKAELSLIAKIADLEAKIEKASFEKRPAIREELIDLRADLAKAHAAVTAAEAPLPRSRFLDSRAARRADFEAVDHRAAAAGVAARASVVTAVCALSEACVLGKAAGGLAVELGGSPAGYVVHADAIAGIDASFFERLSYGSEVAHMANVRFPIVSTLTELPAPGRRSSSGGLVSSEETAAHRAADVELALRK